MIHRIAGRDNLFQFSYFSRWELKSIVIKWLVQGPTAGDWRGWDDRLVFSLLLCQCWLHYTWLQNDPHIWKEELGNSLPNASLSKKTLSKLKLMLYSILSPTSCSRDCLSVPISLPAPLTSAQAPSSPPSWLDSLQF